MSAISLKSITGITSITTPAGVDDVFTVHTNDTTERFRIDQTGNQNIVGIVTVTKDLDVDGHTNLDNVSIAGVTTTQAFQATTGTFTGDVDIASTLCHTGDTDTKITFATNTIKFDTDTEERLRISSTGLIYVNRDGVGGRIDATAGDASIKFGDGNGRQTFKIATMASGQSAAHAFDANGDLNLNTSTNQYGYRLNIQDSAIIYAQTASSGGLEAKWHLDNSAQLMEFGTVTTDNLALVTNNTPKLTILSGGNVGIGTDNPQAKLEIAGATTNVLGYSDGRVQIVGNNPIAFVSQSNLNPALNRWGFKLASQNDGDFSIYDYRNSKNRLLINSSGNIGIGTNLPDQSLELFKASGTNLVKVSTQANSSVGLEIEKTGSTTQTWRIADGQTVNGALEFYDVTDSRRVMGIDGSGRIIIGPGSHAGGSQLVIKGGGTNTYSTLGMFSNHTNPSDNTLLSQIRFGSNATAVGADIRVYADADWGSSNDYPTRMEFYTTPDGSNSRQVRLAIDKDGKIHTGNPASLAIDDFNITATGTGATLSLNRAATGNASDNDLLGAVSFQSYPAGQGYAAAEAAIRAYAETGQSGSAAPTNLIFYTKPSTTGPGASPDERLRITSDGKIGINEGTPEAALHIQTDSGNNRAFQVGTISSNRYLTINHFGGQQNVYNMKIRVNDNALIPMLDLGNPYGSSGHGTQIKFSGYQDNECGAIQLVNTANNNANAVDMVFRTGGTSEKLRITSDGILKTSNAADSVFKFQIDDSIGWWNTNTGLAPNSTRTWTITNVNYGGCKILIGGGDGNYQRAGAIIDVVGTMWANNKSYYHYETIKNSSGASISTTYNNSSIVISVTAGSNWWYYSMSIESHRRSSGANFPTVSVS